MDIKLKAGIPLVTKDSNRYSNAVVFSVKEAGDRVVVTVLTDFCNKLVFPYEQDVFEYWDISEGYKEYYLVSKELDIDDRVLDSAFCLRDRLSRQLELINKAIEELE